MPVFPVIMQCWNGTTHLYGVTHSCRPSSAAVWSKLSRVQVLIAFGGDHLDRLDLYGFLAARAEAEGKTRVMFIEAY